MARRLGRPLIVYAAPVIGSAQDLFQRAKVLLMIVDEHRRPAEPMKPMAGRSLPGVAGSPAPGPAPFVRDQPWDKVGAGAPGPSASRSPLGAKAGVGGWAPRSGRAPGASTAMNDVTRILSAIEQGDPKASGELLPVIYRELRRLAQQRLALEKPGQTLQATALVHEAYLRLVGAGDAPAGWGGRGHFFAAAAEAMRRISLAATPKNCVRLSHRMSRWSTRRRYASWTSAVGWRVCPATSRSSARRAWRRSSA